METNYTSEMCGKIPKHWLRPEIQQLKDKGYDIENPQDAVRLFEEEIAKFAGSKYAVAVDNCTDGIFLCLKLTQQNMIDFVKGNPFYRNVPAQLSTLKVTIPKRTYCSVPMAIINSGSRLKFKDEKWKGVYQLYPWTIYDSATRFTEGMYIPNSLYIISFQFRKRLSIGKGGMILTNDKKAYDWLIKARYEGRDLNNNQWDDEYAMVGWNMYMTPDSAARGLLLFKELTQHTSTFPDFGDYTHYPDLSKKKVFQPYLTNSKHRKLRCIEQYRDKLGRFSKRR